MKIKKENIKKIISILESKYNELKEGEYFEFNGKELTKTKKQITQFCIKQNASKKVCEWFKRKHGTTSADIKGGFKYIWYDNGETGFHGELIYPEITEQQFKEFIKDKI